MDLKAKLATVAASAVCAAALAGVPTTAAAHHWDYCSCVAETGGDFDYCAQIYMQTLCATAEAPTTIVWDRR